MFREFDKIEIQRKNGYLDFDSYLKQAYGRKSIQPILDKKRTSKEGNCWINILNQTYMFKPCDKEEVLKELLAAEMLEYIGIEHAQYDMAYMHGTYGVITKDLKKENCCYVTGTKLIEDYCSYIDPKVDKDNINYSRFNNLEDIWTMLELKYFAYPNKRYMIKNVVEKICEKFIFDILCCQWDGADYNWIIEESQNSVTLFPLYDHSKMLDGLDLKIAKNENIMVEQMDRKTYDNVEELKKFFGYSNEHFQDLFLNMFEALDPDNIRRFMIAIEREIQYKFEDKLKLSILSRYSYNYQRIKKMLEEEFSIKR